MPKIASDKPPVSDLKPLWTTADGGFAKLWHGDVLAVLDQLPAKSVQMCVTSPPYWGLRDYGTAKWEGGREDCDHIKSALTSSTPLESEQKKRAGLGLPYAGACGKCGAKRIDQQIGSEKTPEEFIAKMVAVFAEVRRVLRDDGTLWLNLGDSYGGGGNLSGVPWRVALSLCADGWVLRQDVIWAKPSPMPESIANRCTKSHEHLFIFAKQDGYFYDAEAIKTDASPSVRIIGTDTNIKALGRALSNGGKGSGDMVPGGVLMTDGKANKRDVWTVDDGRSLLDWLQAKQPELLEEFLRESQNKADV